VEFGTTLSASWKIRTKLAVLAGAVLHWMAGEISGPACEYRNGIIPPSGQAVVVRVMV
jgi:hypothetical protein